jgi:hypothetical protein
MLDKARIVDSDNVQSIPAQNVKYGYPCKSNTVSAHDLEEHFTAANPLRFYGC